mgnify:CR=1 FL=1
MKIELVNIKHLQEYEQIFSRQKMEYLWREYLSCSKASWNKLDSMNEEQMRLAFHSWKSSSQIFGMEDFVRQCAAIEEKLSKRQSRSAMKNLISLCRQCYLDSTAKVAAYFKEKQGDGYGQ